MAASSHHGPGPDDGRREWIVLWHLAAVEEFNHLKEMKVRKAVVSVVAALRQRGPRLSEPHSKKVRGDEKLYELRPAGGRVLVRPLYARLDDGMFVVLAVGPEAVTDPRGFIAARARARARAHADFGWKV
jgi:hypothetical protein